jgi:splicing factor 3A subunit 3
MKKIAPHAYHYDYSFRKNISPETKAAVQDALLTGCKILEQARCLETEREANRLMAASLLAHGGVPEVDVTALPGGIQDAWVILSENGTKSTTTTATTIAADPEKEHLLKLGQGQAGKVTQMAGLAGCLQRATVISNDLMTLRRPEDGARLKKLAQAAKSVPSEAWLHIFDQRLREIRAYHARHSAVSDGGPNKRQRLGNPVADGYDLASSISLQVDPIKDGTVFQSEEIMGKYMDLQLVYESHVVPIKQIFVKEEQKTSSYSLSDFLSQLSSESLESIPEARKLKERKKYTRLLVALEKYLEGFLKRTQPILNLKDVTSPAIADFESEWGKTGGYTGWEAKPAEAVMARTGDNASDASKTAALDLAPYASAADLEKASDGDTLKAELSRLGLKCGGTVIDRAKRLFMTKDTPLNQLPKKLFAKGAKQTNGETTKNERRIDIARREVEIMALLNQLRPVSEATLRRLERRETQTLNEREKETEEDLHGSVVEGPKEKNDDYDSDDDEDAPIYNPKGVPLGWDGKPIPYWLFKLHGLNHFYPCEICGNESYRGRRNFETHFAEAKHSYGMKSLGIPNTKHFHGVTKIEDAQNLWDKLKDQLDQQQFDGSKEEEYEDSHGNVLSRATYEDLARQGLL